MPHFGIDKLTCRRGLALPDMRLNGQYVDARAHSARVLTSKDAGHSHIPITELVNLSIPSEQCQPRLHWQVLDSAVICAMNYEFATHMS